MADHLVDGELSVGDFVLAGGELAALVVVEAVARLLPGVLGNGTRPRRRASRPGSSSTRSTRARPCSGAGPCPRCSAPATTSGSRRWRHAQALARTLERRPDLIEARGGLTESEVPLLSEFDEIHGLRDRRLSWLSPNVPDALTIRRRGPEPAGSSQDRPAAPATTVERAAGETPAMNPTDIIDQDSLRDDMPDFRPATR